MRRSVKPHPHPKAQRTVLGTGVVLGHVVFAAGLAGLAWQAWVGAQVLWPILVLFAGTALIFVSMIGYAAPDDETEDDDRIPPTKRAAHHRRWHEMGH